MEPLADDATKSRSRSPQKPDRKRRNQKPRILFSCTTCRKDKLKCDREKPCSNCVKRHREPSCTYTTENIPRADTAGEFGLDDHLRSLDARLRSLENRSVETEPPDGNSYLNPSTPQMGSTASFKLAPTCDTLQPGNDETLFPDSSYWAAAMDDNTNELHEYHLTKQSGEQDKPLQGPALLTGLSNGASFIGHLGALPPRETADALVTRCLNAEEAFPIMIHAPTFKREYLEFWQYPDIFPPAWVSLLFGVLCCSIWMDQTTDSNTTNKYLPSTFEVYRTQSAAFLAKSDITTPGRYKVEAAVLYLGMEYVRTENLKSQVSVLLGLVSQLAMVAGYHRDTHKRDHITVFEAEMRRRTWLALLVTDCVVAYETGLPQVISREVGDSKRPRNLLDEDFGPLTSNLPPARTESENCVRITYMTNLDSILSIAAKIENSLTAPASSPDRTIELGEELDAAGNNVPAILRIPTNESTIADKKMTLWRFNLEMTYQRTRCILHRPFIIKHSMDPQTQYFRRACVAAAQRIIELEYQVFQVFLRKTENRHRVWFGASRTLSDGLTAVMVICLELFYRARDEQQPDFPTSEQLIQSVKALYMSWKCAPRPSPEIDRAAEILARMLRRMGVPVPDQIDEPLPPSIDQHSLDTAPRTTNLPNNDISQPQGDPIDEMLNADPTVDMFDWALWDREIQSLDI